MDWLAISICQKNLLTFCFLARTTRLFETNKVMLQRGKCLGSEICIVRRSTLNQLHIRRTVRKASKILQACTNIQSSWVQIRPCVQNKQRQKQLNSLRLLSQVWHFTSSFIIEGWVGGWVGGVLFFLFFRHFLRFYFPVWQILPPATWRRYVIHLPSWCFFKAWPTCQLWQTGYALRCLFAPSRMLLQECESINNPSLLLMFCRSCFHISITSWSSGSSDFWQSPWPGFLGSPPRWWMIGGLHVCMLFCCDCLSPFSHFFECLFLLVSKLSVSLICVILCEWYWISYMVLRLFSGCILSLGLEEEDLY